MCPRHIFFFFFFNDTATTEIYTLSLHDALPILQHVDRGRRARWYRCARPEGVRLDRKSTRLNSSHLVISYAVFCLKKKKNNNNNHSPHRKTDHVIIRSQYNTPDNQSTHRLYPTL